jgi:PTH2 family peptidyl-tRNA hydrolase
VEGGRFGYKQVIVVRTDLKMGRGKMAAQVAHAAVSCAREAEKRKPEWFRSWWQEGQAKIVVRAESESELRFRLRLGEELGLPVSLVVDRGLTQLEPDTVTCLGVGPGPSELVDRVTGDCRLL